MVEGKLPLQYYGLPGLGTIAVNLVPYGSGYVDGTRETRYDGCTGKWQSRACGGFRFSGGMKGCTEVQVLPGLKGDACVGGEYTYRCKGCDGTTKCAHALRVYVQVCYKTWFKKQRCHTWVLYEYETQF